MRPPVHAKADYRLLSFHQGVATPRQYEVMEIAKEDSYGGRIERPG